MVMILHTLAGLGFLICLVIVLIKQFQMAGTLHGMLGLFTCGLSTFIWGWMRATTLGLRKIMVIWSLITVAMVVLAMVGWRPALSGLGG